VNYLVLRKQLSFVRLQRNRLVVGDHDFLYLLELFGIVFQDVFEIFHLRQH
jgi:hypothetical protein